MHHNNGIQIYFENTPNPCSVTSPSTEGKVGREGAICRHVMDAASNTYSKH